MEILMRGRKVETTMRSASIVTAIYETYDYDQFVILAENRDLNTLNLAKLEKSMQEEYLLIPILVNEKMEVIDGQHRLEMCKKLGLPVYFYIVEGYGISQVQRSNAVSCPWDYPAFLKHHMENNKEPYTVLHDLQVKYGVGIGFLLKLFAGIQGIPQKVMNEEFKDGEFQSDGLLEVLNFLTALEDFSYFENYKSQAFFCAFMKLYFYEHYDHKKMKVRIQKRGYLLKQRTTMNDYLFILTKEIYSFGAVKSPVHYDIGSKKLYVL